MIFGPTPLDEAEGAILAHSVRLKECVLKKGTVLDADAIASRMGVRLSTVRTHIAHLLAKTQSDRQLLMLARLQGRA